MIGCTALLVAVPGCSPETPPAPDPLHSGPPTAAQAAVFDPKGDAAVLTYAAERGAFADAGKVEDVPEASRGLVRVTLPGGEPPPAGAVWVTNLRKPDPEGRYALSTVPRDLFEELALGQGLASPVALPGGLEPPEKAPALLPGQVVVYKTAWCGVCKKVEAYLKRKGVDYEAKDIEKDRDAAAELQAKAQAGGVPLGSVPVIDVGGELIVGFDRARLETLLPTG